MLFDSYSFHMSDFSPFLNSEDITREDLIYKLLHKLYPQIMYSNSIPTGY